MSVFMIIVIVTVALLTIAGFRASERF